MSISDKNTLMHIKKALLDQSKSSSKKGFGLAINQNGYLEYRKLTTAELSAKRLGLGKASLGKIRKYLLQHESDLHKIANECKKNDEDENINKMQSMINMLFEQKSELKKAPDMFLKINENWMGQLPPETKEKKINEFILPGTHDSGAFQLKLNKTPKGNMWSKIATAISLSRMFGSKKFLEDFTLTQNYDLTKQLELGARYFDFRVSYNESDNKYYLSHSLACVELETAMKQIRTFMDQHPNEVIMLQIEADERHRKNFTNEHTDGLIKLLDNHIGNLAVRQNNPSNHSDIHAVGEKTYNELVAKNQRVILGFAPSNKIKPPSSKLNSDLQSICWQSDLNNQGWLNAPSVDKGLEKIENKINASVEEKNQHKMHCIATSLTPKDNEISDAAIRKFVPITKIFSRFKKAVPSTIERGRKMNEKVPEKLNSGEGKYKGIVYCDAPDHSATFNHLIKLNSRRK